MTDRHATNSGLIGDKKRGTQAGSLRCGIDIIYIYIRIFQKMKHSKPLLLFILGFLAFWANGDNYAAAPLLPSIARDLGLSIPRAALSVTAYMLSFGLFTILFGPLSDKFGKGRVIKIAALGTSVFSILGGFSFNFESLVVFRAFNGIFGAGIFPVTMALIGSEFDDKSRQGAMAKVMGMMFLGGASATVIGGVLAQVGSWRTVYILYGIAELVLTLFVLRVVPDGDISEKPFNFAASYAEAFKRPGLLRTVAMVFFVGFAVFGSFSYSGHYVQNLTGFPIILVGLIVTAFGAGTAASSMLIPRVKPILGQRLLPVAGVVGAVSLALVVLASLFSVQVPLMLILGFFGFGLAFVVLQSSLVMTAQSKLPQMRGTAMSLVSFGMFVGGGVGTQFNGILISLGGIAWIYAVAGIFILGVSLSMASMVRERAGAESGRAAA
ncbi:MAG TPA: MFS transporter [Treponema sp.]|nr:MFS transporter [Treponema sp.]